MNYDFYKIFKNFKIQGEFYSCEPYGEGHINKTFLLRVRKDGGEKRYILQRINSTLFPDVKSLMQNIKNVTEFIRAEAVKNGGDPYRETLTIIDAVDGKPYYFDGENYFRVYLFIENATAYQTVKSSEHFYQSAVAFGNFVKLLANFNANTLYTSLPNFHDTAKRFNELKTAIEQDRVKRVEKAASEIEFALARKNVTEKIFNLIKSGKVPLRITHNDTKLNNVLIDNETQKAVAVIDLDTVMTGSVLFDFGDAIRYGCNVAREDEIDISRVKFDMNLFETFVNGYIDALFDLLTPTEVNNLAFSAILMTYECGIRFLTDFLNGDTYFKVERKNQNLDRAKTQFKLVYQMEQNLDEMNEIVLKRYASKLN